MADEVSEEKADGVQDELFPIRAATQACWQSLQECGDQASLQEGHWAENRSSDFNLWISGIGAYANELNCLDKRLEGDVSAQKVVMGALSTLVAWTIKCIELAKAMKTTEGLLDRRLESNLTSADEQSSDTSNGITLTEAKSNVESLLEMLVDLEVAIRRAGTASRVRRADRTFRKRQNHYTELSEHLEFILQLSGAPRRNDILPDQRSLPADIDEIDVTSTLDQLQRKKAPLRPEQQILLVANLKRTHRFLFYKSRQKRLQPEVAQESVHAARAQITSPGAQSSSSPTEIEERVARPSQIVPNEHTTQTHTQSSAGTTDWASEYVHNTSLGKDVKAISPDVAATTIALRAHYPRLPKDKTMCPYCFIPFKDIAGDIRQWKKHVSEDLQPYTCYLPNCLQDHPLFDTFSLWKAHILSKDHQQFEGWVCLFCQFSSSPAEESIFQDHIQKTHSNAVAREALAGFAKMCCQYTTPALDRCPVCSIYESDWTLRKDGDPKYESETESFWEHLGQCMHNFALKVLPEAEPLNVDDKSGQNLTDVSPNEDRSWPSCYLHVSHHTDGGLAKTDLETVPSLINHDQVDKHSRTLVWLNLTENVGDPNSLEETLDTDRNLVGRSVLRRRRDGRPVQDSISDPVSRLGQFNRRNPAPRRETFGGNATFIAASEFLRGFRSLPRDEKDTSVPEVDAEGQSVGDDYVIGKQIGFGGFSVIKEAIQILPATGEQRKLAVKIRRRNIEGLAAMANEAAQAEFEREVDVWRSLNHKNILPLEAVYELDQATFCFIPLNVGGTLFDLVRANRSGLPLESVKSYALQLVSALRYLHLDARVVHRDVKLENCLIDTTKGSPGVLRLCDFGMADWISKDSSRKPRISESDEIDLARQRVAESPLSSFRYAQDSLEYAPPETLMNANLAQVWPSSAAGGTPVASNDIPTAVDIWAFGVCLYAMIVGKRPFSDAFTPRIVASVMAGQWDRELLLQKCDDDTILLELVGGCLTVRQSARWDVERVSKCTWFDAVRAKFGDS